MGGEFLRRSDGRGAPVGGAVIGGLLPMDVPEPGHGSM